MAITPLPTPPSRAQAPANFSSTADAFIAALPTFTTEANALAAQVEGAAATAESAVANVSTLVDQATAASNSAVSAVAATLWVSGTTYSAGAVVWSPTTFFSYRRKVTGAGTTDPVSDTTNWALLTNTIFNDETVSRAMFRDVGYVFVDKGDSGTTTQTVDFSAGTHQRIRATGNFTLAFSNWPPTGNFGEVLLELVADGTGRVITFPAGTKFLKFDGSTTTTFSQTLITLQTANGAVDWLYFWTRDAGTTLYCKVVR
ncbi:MAG: hypothetical protein EOM03_16915 [Clostridia bacterium]|nr:hypothetical protein [Clostridia bacterium]